MREVQKRQLQFGQIPVDKVWLDPKSRDDIPAVLKGLQHLYKEKQEELFMLLEKHILPGTHRGVGRPGMEMWRILVLGVLKQGLGCDFDRLHNLANHHETVRAMLGHSEFADKTHYELQTIVDNVSLMRPELLVEVGRLVVESGHAVARKKPGERLRGRCDSLVVETDVHYPTDLGLLWDAVRCLIRETARAAVAHGVGGWRQHRHLGKRVKEGFNPVRSARRGKQTPEKVEAYLGLCRDLVERAEGTVKALVKKGVGEAECRLIRGYIDHARRQIGQVDRRLLQGERIPHQEKVFSIFEPHTRWISKGKAGRPVELGVAVCVVEDQYQFILHHKLLWKEDDVEVAVPMVEETQALYPDLRMCSFDRGFHSRNNRIRLDDRLELNALPGKGRRNRALPQAHNFFLDTLSSAWHNLRMYQQHCILETLTSEAGAARVAALMSAETFPSRTAAGRRVCEAFGFRDAGGRLQQAGCVKALRVLEAAGRIGLPERLNRGGGRQPRDLGEGVPAAEGVPEGVEAVEGLRLVLVREEGERHRWNGLMAREHPRGAVRHAGAQLRYLIVSAHGTLGGMGFAASALALAARDRWMGWEEATRKQQLHRVVGMSRFLIREGVKCRNLASKALGMVLGRLGEDFQQRYRYRPVLVETFVDEASHRGTSLKATNWIRVGETAGRGRFAATDGKVAVKAIYLYPLVEDWREQLGILPPEPIRGLGCGEGLDREEWAENELGGARLGDERLSRRLVRSASVQAGAPMASFPSAAQSDKAMVMGYYRMIDQPADSEVRPENILAPHRARTLRRMQGKEVVLCLQDGTDLNFAEHEGCQGLGLIGKNQRASGTLGLHMHSTLVVDGEGVPLGVPQIQYEAPEATGQKRKPAPERKTQRWVEGLRECARLASELEGVRPVSVMDREGDIFELFIEQRRLGTVDLLVRAQHNRRLGRKLPKLFERVRAARAQAGMEIEVGRRSARRGTRQQKASEKREGRLARVGLRWRTVELAPPRNGDFTEEAPVRLNLVHVREESAPEGVRPLEWFLLTTVGVRSSREAKQVLEWYRLRWRIEDWHRVLKTGCKAEYLGHQSGDRIERAVTIKAVIAWRLMAMTLLGRERPELPAEVLFSDMEILALKDFAQDRRLRLPDTLGPTVVTLAMLGGYLNRNNDRPPGHQKIWEGYVRLATMAQTYERLIKLNRTSNLYERLRPG